MLALFNLSYLSLRTRKQSSRGHARAHKYLIRRQPARTRGWHFQNLHGEPLEDRRMMAVDVILEWNAVLLEANARDHARTTPEQGGPILTARTFAITSAAMYDAYNSVNRIGDSYLVSLGVKGADVDAAVAQAAYTTLVSMYPAQRSLFNEALTHTLARTSGKSEMLGRALGTYVGLRYLVDRHNDGMDELKSNTYVYSGLPGFHKVDPLHPNQGYYASSAMDVDPFVVDTLDQFAARRLDDGTPAGRMAFMASEEYTLAYNEVLSLGGSGDAHSPTVRTPEQTNIGLYWAYDGRPGIGTPPRLYNQIARTVAAGQHNTEAQNARMFALVNIAMFDAGLTAWKNKYDDAFWRPIMGIRGGAIDDNPATVGVDDWTPLGAPASNPRPGETNFTPPFPAYTSGHATFGAAAFEILERFYGRDDISFTFVSDELNGKTRDADGSIRPRVSRTFDSFTDAKLENAQSRIYLGIHWAFDRDDGVRTGDVVADFVFEHALRAKPTRTGTTSAEPLASPLAISAASSPGADAHFFSSGSDAAHGTANATSRAATELGLLIEPPRAAPVRPAPKRTGDVLVADARSVDRVMHDFGESDDAFGTLTLQA